MNNQDYKEKYILKEKIGFGAFTEVFRATKRDNKKELRAIKIINLEAIKDEFEKEGGDNIKQKLNDYIAGIENEIEYMKICAQKNENSVKFYESFINDKEFAIVLELCNNCLSKYKNDKRFNSKKIHEILNQLNNTLKIMKEKQIVHRDLKPDNILIKIEKDNKQIIKLCDYGISKIGNLSKLRTHIGTLHYMAPEILEGQTYYTYKCDLWSLGIVIYELFFKEKPYNGTNEVSLLANIKLKKNNYLKETDDKNLNDLIKKLLEINPEKRLTWDDYFNHPYFNDNINIKKSKTSNNTHNNKIDNNNEITIQYKKTENKNKIRIFGKYFVENNKNKCQIKYKGGHKILEEYIDIKEDENDIIEIKLNGVNDILDISYMFADCDCLKSLSDISKWKVDEVINMSYMFYNCESLQSLPDISKWNVDKVTNMSHMFSNCESLTYLPDISKWNTSNVTNMSDIFSNCKLLKSLPDISNWNTNKITNLSYMVFNCESLESLPDISKWKTNKVTNMSYMFFNCKSLKSLPNISLWSINSIKNMNGMFFGCNFPLTNLSKFLN